MQFGCTSSLPVEQGQSWLEGDNPDLSEDSRSKYGPASLSLAMYLLHWQCWQQTTIVLIEDWVTLKQPEEPAQELHACMCMCMYLFHDP